MKSSKWLAAGLVLSLFTACGGKDDDKDGSSADKEKNSSLERIAGTWKYTSGTQTIVCSGTSFPENLSGNIRIEKGSSSDLVLVDEDCSFKLKIDGNRARLDGTQTCTVSVPGGSQSFTVENYTFTSEDGKVARLSASGNVTESAGGASVTCTVSQSGDLEKL